MKNSAIWRWIRDYFWNPVSKTWDRFQKDDGSLMAAAVSYYAGVSLLPLLIVLVSGLGVFLKTTTLGQDAREQVLSAVETEASSQLRGQIESVLSQVQKDASLGGSLGLLGMLFGAVAIFAQFERAFDIIWNVPPSEDMKFWQSLRYLLLERFRAFIMLCSLGLLIILIFLAGMTLSTVEQVASRWLPIPHALSQFLEWSVSLVLNTLAFTLLYRFLPKVEVRWREALAGAVLVSVGWEIGRHILSNILIGTRYTNAYGTLGSFLAVLLWLYYASHLLFLGAEFIQFLCAMRHKANSCLMFQNLEPPF